MKKILILGVTGSIGVQTLEVIKNLNRLGHEYEVAGVSFARNGNVAIDLINEFKPRSVAVIDKYASDFIRDHLIDGYRPDIYTGKDSVVELINNTEFDICVNSIVGIAGLIPSYEVIKKKKKLALANKETIVVDGINFMNQVRRDNIELIPVDSEHSAIYQCLYGSLNSEISKLIITCSGGPFFGKDIDYLKTVTPEMALVNPNWKMGKRITIDSAILVNKGFEVIEASRLFSVDPDRIEVVIHRESIIHSMVEFVDRSIIAQLGNPDMRLPIQYAMTERRRFEGLTKSLDLTELGHMSFYKPDVDTFKGFKLCLEALKKGGNSTAVLNAADEVAVNLFLGRKIIFTQIPELIELALNKIKYISNPNTEQILETDRMTRELLSGCF